MRRYRNGIPAGNVGEWFSDDRELPVFCYRKELPSETQLPSGESVSDPEDPWFLLGNFQFTCFAHASGVYEIFTTERSHARLHPAPERLPALDASSACIEIGDPSRRGETTDLVELTGLESHVAMDPAVERCFGTGFAHYHYPNIAGIELTRTLATLPSRNFRDGVSGMVITVEVKNNTDRPRAISYSESLTGAFDFLFWRNFPCLGPAAEYAASASVRAEQFRAEVRFAAEETVPLAVDADSGLSREEALPPCLFLQLTGASHPQFGRVVSSGLLEPDLAEVSGSYDGVLGPRESVVCRFLVGYHQARAVYTMEDLVERLERQVQDDPDDPTFRRAWAARLPTFAVESNPQRRLEMAWHVYCLHAMATWCEETEEAYVPQGTIYDYRLGTASVIRDHLQHLLPLCHVDADLARSGLRHAFRQMDESGHLRAAREGAGRVALGPDQKSDSQLYLFLTTSEYLVATEDYAFLLQKVPYTGGSMQSAQSIIDHLERAFLYLRDTVGTGPNGLVRLLCSDWNDCFYRYFKDLSYHEIFWTAESHLNTALAVYVLGDLSRQLLEASEQLPDSRETGRLLRLVNAMQHYREQLWGALQSEWEGRDFLPRATVEGKRRVGHEQLFLEPQSFALLIPELTPLRWRALRDAVVERVWKMEQRGARQSEAPQPGFKDAGFGSRENGGIWYALNGPLALGVARHDPDLAAQMLDRMSLAGHARAFPNYWVGMWSGPDSYDSSLRQTEGLGAPYTRPFPVYCAHAHAWPLFVYLKIATDA